MSNELASMNSVIYSVNNPDSELPLDDLTIAVFLYIELEISGLNENGQHCTQKIAKMDLEND